MNSNTPVELFYDNSDNSVLSYSGSWDIEDFPGIPNATVQHAYHQTSASDASVSMTFSDAVGVSMTAGLFVRRRSEGLYRKGE